ncbi:acylphosphatase [Pollutibacter soli]|uniref:acylphosphatase n=1 Tax=Pollutibacter soli TaxID=3034157 RepID=UPI0030133EEC
MVTKEIIFSGKVQGVYYRASAKEVADSLGLTGRVKNLRDGRVWMIATGTEEQMERFIAWNRKGPSAARIELLETRMATDPGYTDFRIERDN